MKEVTCLSILNARFLLAILVEEKTTFFVTALFSHHTPRSNFIEERQAMRYISRLIRSWGMPGTWLRHGCDTGVTVLGDV
jgi:hypothetical protein